MKMLNDNDFDEIFKNRISDELPEFEEESWSKMEKKLKKRDRIIFYRYASIILVFLSLGVILFSANQKIQNQAPKVTNKKSPVQKQQISPKEDVLAPSIEREMPENEAARQSALHRKPKTNQSKTPLDYQTNILREEVVDNTNTTQVTTTTKVDAIVLRELTNTTLPQQAPETAVVSTFIKPVPSTVDGEAKEQKKSKFRIPITLAINAGPDFNSTSNVVGGRGNIFVGFAIGVGLTKRVTIQSGLNYGEKNYTASPTDYTFSYAMPANTLTEIEAACKVLEIPLKLSYNLTENTKRAIALNAGLSSYLMLNEKYTYKYTPRLYREDRTMEYSNENQHFFGVLDLSATYYAKLKSKKLAFGITPYVKIPLSGVGAGRVPLNSSGISLNLRYDFNKK